MKLLVLALFVSASALMGPGKKRDLREIQLQKSTRESKSFCTKASELQTGSWVSLKEGEYAEAPAGNNCNPMKMMWEPNNCKLPYHSEEIKKQSGRVVFVGDSITDISARSFAWFKQKLWSKDLNSCTYQKEDVQKTVRPKLLKAGFNAAAVATTLQYMEEQGFRKNHHWWGCNASVQYIPTDQPPPQSAVKPFMFALKNFGKTPLGPDDTIVMNWGQWAKEDKGEWGPSMKLLMKEYAKWKEAKTAPKLIWREVSPTHWGAGVYEYSQKLYDATQTTHACAPAGGPKLMEAQQKRPEQFPLKNNNLFKEAVKDAGLEIDGVNIEFLPVWRGTAERFEDHQPLTKYQIDQGQKIDCTHFCVHGNVNRFWNSALVAVIGSMKDKQV